MEYTNIQIRVTTRDKLKDAKIVRKESYDEVINRLLENVRNKGGHN